MSIEINNNIINVSSEFGIVYFRLKQFEIEHKETKNKIIINNDLIDIDVLDYKLKIEKEINTTDIYPILNNLIAYLINDDDNLYIHSVLISKNNKGILILGDFKAGKSSLGMSATKKGYHINSTDQTWIKNDNLIQGSIYNRIGENITFIDIKDSKEKVKIKKIIIIKGIVQNGDLNIIKLNNDNYYVKNIFKYANWHYDMPLLTEYTKLKDTGKKMIGFLKKNKIETYLVYGNADNIMEVIDD